jgi:outer membrane protein assembly factor BamA
MEHYLVPFSMKNLFLYCAVLCFATHAWGQEANNSMRFTIRHINIIGNKVTKSKSILREMNVAEGSEIRSDSLAILSDINRDRIYNLAIFTDVIINIDTVSATMVDWNIKVKEQWFLMPEVSLKLADRNFNVWWKEQHRDIRRANFGLTLKHRNFRGDLENLSATAQVGYTQKFGMEYYRPYIDKKQRHGFGASFFISKNEEIYYTTDSNKLKFIKTRGNYIIREVEAAGLYVFRPGYAYKHQLELRYIDHQVDDTLVKLNPEYYENKSNKLKLMQITYRFDINKVDNWNYPLYGFKMVGQAVARLGMQGVHFQSYFHLETGYFYQLSNKWYASHILRGRVTYPLDQPYIYRDALGSETEYLRGYEYYVIDGSQYGLLRNDLKYELLNIKIRNIPLRYLATIPIRLYPKIFTDLGYVSYRYPGNSFLNNRMIYSYGFGLDIITVYDLKLRLEYAWNHLTEKGLFLHINSE